MCPFGRQYDVCMTGAKVIVSDTVTQGNIANDEFGLIISNF